jgi:hypothetical protein
MGSDLYFPNEGAGNFRIVIHGTDNRFLAPTPEPSQGYAKDTQVAAKALKSPMMTPALMKSMRWVHSYRRSRTHGWHL